MFILMILNNSFTKEDCRKEVELAKLVYIFDILLTKVLVYYTKEADCDIY
jgi:hypothetical protein